VASTDKALAAPDVGDKAVIMSSKKCLALYGSEIMSTVKQYHGIFHYDATVGGGIPISSVFETMGRCETIEKIYGICNGTSNYILDKMEQKGISYEHALNKAIKKGYAENNPSEDVEGYDSLYKAVIMMGFGMNCWIDSKTISPKAITNLTHHDFELAKKSHNVIKPLFILEKTAGSITCDIGPKLIPKNSLLATVKENNNIIVVYGSESRERAFYGQGAGKKPTASAMFDDLIKTIKEVLLTNLLIDNTYYKNPIHKI
jgi:homoserine dehydrogenase